MTNWDLDDVERRLRRYAEEAVRDMANLPYARWHRVNDCIYWDEEIGDDDIQFNAELTKSDDDAFRLAITATLTNAEFHEDDPMRQERPWMFPLGYFLGDARELRVPSVTIGENIEVCGELEIAEPNSQRSDDPTEVNARLQRYADDALRDLLACLPQSRLGRVEGEMTWEENIDGDEMLFHAMTLEFTEAYLHLTTEASLGNPPMNMIKWSRDYPTLGSYGEFPSRRASDVIPRTLD